MVDTFLLISGFLMCRLLLLELEKRNGKINVLYLYIMRYIRLVSINPKLKKLKSCFQANAFLLSCNPVPHDASLAHAKWSPLGQQDNYREEEMLGVVVVESLVCE